LDRVHVQFSHRRVGAYQLYEVHLGWVVHHFDGLT
jgi:hypothetical protein